MRSLKHCITEVFALLPATRVGGARHCDKIMSPHYKMLTIEQKKTLFPTTESSQIPTAKHRWYSRIALNNQRLKRLEKEDTVM